MEFKPIFLPFLFTFVWAASGGNVSEGSFAKGRFRPEGWPEVRTQS
jgi:hypothetical protein